MSKLLSLFCFCAFIASESGALAQPKVSTDEAHFFITMNAALGAANTAAATHKESLSDRLLVAEGFTALASKAEQLTNINLDVKLQCVATALDQARWMLRRTQASIGPLSERAYTNAFSALAIGTRILAQTPEPRLVAMPVALPVSVTTGVSGMDPKSIKDPVARADYERRIAEANQLMRDYNGYWALKAQVRILKDAPYMSR